MGSNGVPKKSGANPPGVGPLTSRTVSIEGRPTQVRLEPSYWEALDDICRREDLAIDELFTDLQFRLDQQTRRVTRPNSTVSIANAARVFIVGYYRQAATETGHNRAGHGRGDPLNSTPFAGTASGKKGSDAR
ncbi:MAG TPA: ribbon-helix-helix domain-containing protein [Azospirillum sp.]|nr:ribbon-helix-helix domain-containing protein [Azospirillum sp.]